LSHYDDVLRELRHFRNRTIGKSHIESGLVSAAIFPGSLTEPLNGIVPVSTVYESQRIRNKETAEMLKEPNAIERLMPEYRGRAI
jgi:hypothetical protein